jgi:acyl-CoA reductase-like NAD-dependent aldehyde dehydrogenase
MSEVNRIAVRLQHPDKLFIDGRWDAPARDGRLEVISPHTEEVTAVVAEARETDMDRAVRGARQAFDRGSWPKLSLHERADYLLRLGAQLKLRAPELELAWTQQVGALAVMAPGMVGGAIGLLDHYANLADSFSFAEKHKSFDGHGLAVVAREPVGVVVAIAPWNAPFAIMINKIAPALLAGCTVIMKPSPETPLDAYIIAESAAAAGFPPGVLNLLPSHREAADYLVRNVGVDKVSFTGSTIAGKRIASVCGERIARTTLELGGKSAAIVCEDADVESTAKHLAFVISILSGQVCATLSRVIVPRARYGAFTEALTAELTAIKVGDPFDPGSQMGPLAMRRQLERVEGYIAKGLAEGARIACGGGRPKNFARGCYFEPTLFTHVQSGMTVAQDEIFGPVIALLSFEDEEDAVRIANDSNYGLFGAVFTHDNDRAYRIARGVRAGALTQNGFRMDTLLPFGGFKQSGIGREGGAAGLASYTELKTILLDGPPSHL